MVLRRNHRRPGTHRLAEKGYAATSVEQIADAEIGFADIARIGGNRQASIGADALHPARAHPRAPLRDIGQIIVLRPRIGRCGLGQAAVVE